MIFPNVTRTPCRFPAHSTVRVLLCCLFLVTDWLSAREVPAAAAESETGQARVRLDLNGTWEFRTDPANQGAAQGWHAADAKYPQKIKMPGCWQAQGV